MCADDDRTLSRIDANILTYIRWRFDFPFDKGIRVIDTTNNMHIRTPRIAWNRSKNPQLSGFLRYGAPFDAYPKNQTNTLMKARKLLVVGMLLGTCVFASAQDKSMKEEKSKKELSAKTIKKYDKNGDGKLSEEEAKAMAEEKKEIAEKRHEEKLKNYDTDGNGKLSDEEKIAMHKTEDAKKQQILEKYDANKNGNLEGNELKAASDAGEKIPANANSKRGPKKASGASPK